MIGKSPKFVQTVGNTTMPNLRPNSRTEFSYGPSSPMDRVLLRTEFSHGPSSPADRLHQYSLGVQRQSFWLRQNHANDKMTLPDLPLAVINTHLGYGINRYEVEPPINSASNHKMYTPVTLYITCTLDFLSSSAAKGQSVGRHVVYIVRNVVFCAALCAVSVRVDRCLLSGRRFCRRKVVG